MSLSELSERWGRIELDSLVSSLKHCDTTVPFGSTEEGLLDFRCLPLPDGFVIKGLHLQQSDFSHARIRGTWIEGGVFEGVRFDGADLSGMADHGNSFNDCTFVKTKFREAVIGYRGSAYQKCRFDSADYSKAGFIRAEFDDCRFEESNLKGVDFNASSFVRCSFVGLLQDVWFRGGFSLGSDAKEFGNPRKNEMKDVSFRNAHLHDITFSNGCDLSTVEVPSEGDYRIYSSWKRRLAHLRDLSQEWSPSEAKQVVDFVYSYMVHAQNQDWYLLNADDVRAEYGHDIGDRVLSGLEL